MNRRILSAALGALTTAMALATLPASAQNWPIRPIKLVVPFPPGGLIDNMARLVAPKLAQELGQPIVIDNKPGAGGNLGAGEASRAAADGFAVPHQERLGRPQPERARQEGIVADLGMTIEGQVIRIERAVAFDQRGDPVVDGPGQRAGHVPVHPVVDDQEVHARGDRLAERDKSRVNSRADPGDAPVVLDLEAVERSWCVVELRAAGAPVAVGDDV